MLFNKFPCYWIKNLIYFERGKSQKIAETKIFVFRLDFNSNASFGLNCAIKRAKLMLRFNV